MVSPWGQEDESSYRMPFSAMKHARVVLNLNVPIWEMYAA